MGFLSSFFGGDQRKDIRNASKQANAYLDEGYGSAQGYNEQAYNELEPWATEGLAANRTYQQAIGLGTPEERATAQARYFDDPAMQDVLGQQTNALLRKFNASGSGTGGGRLALAGARVGLENYGGWLNRLQGLGAQGGQYATGQAGIRQGQADTAWGYGATKAGNAINTGNAVAGTRNVGINNLLGAVGTAAKAYTAFSDVRLKHSVTKVGELASGLPVYDFFYHWSDQPHRGVLAHEAREVFPEAVSEDITGYLVVDYSQIR